MMINRFLNTSSQGYLKKYIDTTTSSLAGLSLQNRCITTSSTTINQHSKVCKCLSCTKSNNIYNRSYSTSSKDKIDIGINNETFKKKLVDSYKSDKNSREILKNVKQELESAPTSFKKSDEFQVRSPIISPHQDEELNQSSFTADDFANILHEKEFPDSNREEELLPFSDVNRFKPFSPLRPKIQETEIVDGVSSGYSKRKRSRAVASISEGSGEITINDRPLNEYFHAISYKDAVLSPLVISETLMKWNVNIRTWGGGMKGQAEAIRRALAMALCKYDLAYRPSLKLAGLLKNDARKVERKKPGQLKARKKFPLVKR